MSFDFDWGKNAPYIVAGFAFTGLIMAWLIVDTLARARYWRARAEQQAKDAES